MMERLVWWGVVLILSHLDITTAQDCSSLTTPTEGSMSCTSGFVDGSTCTFTCDAWYTLTGSGSTTCTAGVWSSNAAVCDPIEGALRLVLGTSTRGTLEIYHSGSWGSICHNGFTDTSATVACNQLGLGNVGLAFKGAHFGESLSGAVWVSNVACIGTEANITSCPRDGWSNHACSASMDVGIECTSSYLYRLTGGPTPNAGRVEMYAAGVWMSICDSGFDINAANVTCNKLGYSGASNVHSGGTFGMSTGVIRYTNLACSGNEISLAHCQHVVGDDGVCTHSNDVGVTCQGGPMRLTTNTANTNEGAIELYHGGQWGTMYASPTDDDIAKVVCNYLGFGRIGYMTRYYHHYVHNVPRLLTSMSCTGNETNLVECQHSNWVSSGSYGYGTGAYCTPFEVTDVRLVGGSMPWEGRVEIYVDGTWGTVCDDNWSISDAHVFCRMMGYENGASNAWNYAHFGAGSGDILADDVDCYGTETSINDCQYTKGAGHNCGHSEDASLKCDVNMRCAYMWLLPPFPQFIMKKTEVDQSNYTEIQTTPSLNDIGCTRKCSSQARDICGDFNECSMVKYDSVTRDCTLFHKTNVTASVGCNSATPCFVAVDMF